MTCQHSFASPSARVRASSGVLLGQEIGFPSRALAVPLVNDGGEGCERKPRNMVSIKNGQADSCVDIVGMSILRVSYGSHRESEMDEGMDLVHLTT